MSLDVRLEGPEHEVSCQCACCDHVHTRRERDWYYTANITHNLGRMAEAAGIDKHLWRPEEIGITKAEQLIVPLSAGLERLKADPVHFKQFNAPNGWGLYKHFVPFVEGYLAACLEHPEATVHASR